MPHVMACAMTSCVHCMACTCRQAGHPKVLMAYHKLFICLPFAQAEILLLRVTTTHFNTLNMKYANENVLESILIAM